MKKLIVQLVTWNGEKYIPFLFESLKRQTFTDWTLHILDNGSADATVERIEKERSSLSISSQLVELKKNIGFAGGHNMIFGGGESEYVLLLNQDMYLAPDALEKMVTYLDAHQDVAAVTPRLMRWDFEQVKEKGDAEAGFTDYIDALGLKVFRSRRVIEQYTQQKWSSIQKESTSPVLPVFGVSGAFPMFRRSALKAVSYPDGTFFDESYFSYKEDVDLAFRLTANGQKASVLLNVVAYHDRTAAGPREGDDVSAIQNKKKQSDLVKYYSYRNHLVTLYKNEYWHNTILDFPWILWYELKKFLWYLVFDRKVLKAILELWKMKGDIKKKRAFHSSLRKNSAKDIRRHWKT